MQQATQLQETAPPLRRHQDWPERFLAVFEAHGEMPFTWGRHDCCIAACDLVEAITGVDPAAALRGYSDGSQAKALIRRYGGLLQLAETIAAEVGAPRHETVLQAGRGDVVLALHLSRRSIGAVGLCGRRIYVAARSGGWAVMPLDPEIVLAAWRIG